MNSVLTGGVRGARDLEGPRFEQFQVTLARYNAQRLQPGLPEDVSDDDLTCEEIIARAEIEFVEALRETIAPLAVNIPQNADDFLIWFEQLKEVGPGQRDALFPWLATTATAEQMRWFLLQELAGEAGFEDLLAMTQVKIPVQAKLEIARNFWDEMGRGSGGGMHGPMLGRLAEYFKLKPAPEMVVPESLALGNSMVALAKHRRFAYHSIGALGVIELTAPTRAEYVNRGLSRLGVPAKVRHYFAIHAVLDIKHSQAWNREVLRTLVDEDPRRAQAIGEGAIIRLWHGARTFARYKQELAVTVASRGKAA